MGQPLTGLLVVALEQAVAGPFCTQQLAHAGARVIKVERAEGDFARRYDTMVHGHSSYFAWLNRGKESVVLNIKDPEDLSVLYRIISKADVLVQNLAPGTASRNGLDPDQLRERNRRLITCSISGYGSSGKRAGDKAYDLLIQAESGLAAVTGVPDGMGRVGISICDIAAGLYAYTGILEALIERSLTDEGSNVFVSLFDVMAEWMTVPLLQQAFTNEEPRRLGLHHPSIAPYGEYATATGPIMIAIQNDREWERFCDSVLGRPALTRDERFQTNSARVANRGQLDVEITSHLSRFSRENALEQLNKAEIATGSINSIGDVWLHSDLNIETAATSVGTVNLPRPPLQNIDSREKLGENRIPDLGEHTMLIKSEFA